MERVDWTIIMIFSVDVEGYKDLEDCSRLVKNTENEAKNYHQKFWTD